MSETEKLVEINRGLSKGDLHHPHCLCTCRQDCETVATRIKQSLSNTSDHLRYRFDAHYQTVTAKSEDDLQLTLHVLNANYVDYNFKIYVV
jgi:hypothetical protein